MYLPLYLCICSSFSFQLGFVVSVVVINSVKFTLLSVDLWCLLVFTFNLPKSFTSQPETSDQLFSRFCPVLLLLPSIPSHPPPIHPSAFAPRPAGASPSSGRQSTPDIVAVDAGRRCVRRRCDRCGPGGVGRTIASCSDGTDGAAEWPPTAREWPRDSSDRPAGKLTGRRQPENGPVQPRWTAGKLTGRRQPENGRPGPGWSPVMDGRCSTDPGERGC